MNEDVSPKLFGNLLGSQFVQKNNVIILNRRLPGTDFQIHCFLWNQMSVLSRSYHSLSTNIRNFLAKAEAKICELLIRNINF